MLIFPGPPAIPRGPMQVLDRTPSSIEIKWSPPEDNGGTPITNYIIEMRDVQQPRWRRVTTVSASTTRHRLENLLEGQDYMVRVMARNKEGESMPLMSDIVPAPKVLSKFPI